MDLAWHITFRTSSDPAGARWSPLRQHGEIKALGAGVNIRGTIAEMCTSDSIWISSGRHAVHVARSGATGGRVSSVCRARRRHHHRLAVCFGILATGSGGEAAL